MTKRETALVDALRAVLTGQSNSAISEAHDLLAALDAAPVACKGQPGEAFYHAAIEAKAAAYEADPRWDLHERVLVTLPARLRSFVNHRGDKITMHRDQHMPVARYWPGGRLPAGVVPHADIVRAAEMRRAA